MLLIKKGNKTTLFVDIRKVPMNEILMIACHERRIIGNIAILITRGN